MKGNEELLPSLVNAHALLQTTHEFCSSPACYAAEIMPPGIDKQRENAPQKD
jgi:hypothetical protein